MLDWEFDCRASTGILLRPHTVVMPSSMISHMDYLQTFSSPWMEFLGHIFVINLVHNDVEKMDLGKDVHFELTSPSTGLLHQSNVLFNSHIILNVELVFLLILL